MNIDPSQNFPLTIVQGATLVRNISWNVAGALVNLTGYSALMQWRTTVEDTGTPIIELSTTNGGIVINGTTLTFIVSAAISQSLTNNQTMAYNLFITSPANVITSLLAGPSYVQGSTI